MIQDYMLSLNNVYSTNLMLNVLDAFYLTNDFIWILKKLRLSWIRLSQPLSQMFNVFWALLIFTKFHRTLSFSIVAPLIQLTCKDKLK